MRPVFKFFIPMMFVLLFIFAMGMMGFQNYQNLIELNQNGIKIEGIITDRQAYETVIRTSKNPYGSNEIKLPHYEIKYQFSVPENETVYTCTGGNTGADLNFWCDIPKKKWEQTQVGGPIEVLYSPSNPEINRPFDQPKGGTEDSAGALVIVGIIFSGLCLWIVLQYFLAKKDPENRFMGRHFLWRTKKINGD